MSVITLAYKTRNVNSPLIRSKRKNSSITSKIELGEVRAVRTEQSAIGRYCLLIRRATTGIGGIEGTGRMQKRASPICPITATNVQAIGTSCVE